MIFKEWRDRLAYGLAPWHREHVRQVVRTSRKLDEVEAELSETREMLRLADVELKAWRRGKALPALATEIMRNQAQTEDYKRRAEPK